MNQVSRNAASRAEVFRRRFLRVRISIRSVHYRHRLLAARQTWARNPTGGPHSTGAIPSFFSRSERLWPQPNNEPKSIRTIQVENLSRKVTGHRITATHIVPRFHAPSRNPARAKCYNSLKNEDGSRRRLRGVNHSALSRVVPTIRKTQVNRGFFSFEITHCSWNCPNGTTFAASQNWSPLRWWETEIPKYLDLARNMGMPVIPREVISDKPNVNREKVLHHGHPRWRRSGRKSTGHPVRLPSTKASHLRQRCFYRNSTEFASSLKRPQRGTTSKS